MESFFIFLVLTLCFESEVFRFCLLKVGLSQSGVSYCELRSQVFPKSHYSWSFHSHSTQGSFSAKRRKESESGEGHWALVRIFDLCEAQWKDEGDFRNTVVAHSPKQQRWWVVSEVRVGKGFVCKVCPFLWGFERSMKVSNLWFIT
jgi:hypothetical protein